MGGDGFYAGLKVVYEEPVIKNRVFLGSGYLSLDQHISNERFNYRPGLCPVAEQVQPEMMSFKTNYRDLAEAQRQASILADLIKTLG